jgi:hypothetical protein
MMIAIPAVLIVQRYDKDVGCQEFFQERGAVATARHRVAQIAVQLRQDGGVEQKGLAFRRQLAQHLFGQIAKDEVMAAGEIGNRRGWVLAVLQRQRRQLQPSRPPLDPRIQRRNGFPIERQAHDLVEELGHLRGREAQVQAAQLDQFAPRPQPR